MMSRHADVRAKIIAAAYTVLAEKGYDSTSIKEIAKTAGITPGLIHYYFESKERLLVAVLREASDRYTREMEAMSQQTTQKDLATKGFEEPRERVERQPEWYRLRYELFSLGLRNPSIRAGLADLLANGRRGIGAVVKQTMGEDDATCETLASILLACFDGLALQKLIDPDFDLEVAYGLLGSMAMSHFHVR